MHIIYLKPIRKNAQLRREHVSEALRTIALCTLALGAFAVVMRSLVWLV